MRPPTIVFLFSNAILWHSMLPCRSHAFIIRDARRAWTIGTPLCAGNVAAADEESSPHKKAIQDALEASKKYGATSLEARVAWEIAEEIEDSVFTPCSKRCDPISLQKQKNDKEETFISPLLVDGTKNTTDSTSSQGGEM